MTIPFKGVVIFCFLCYNEFAKQTQWIAYRHELHKCMNCGFHHMNCAAAHRALAIHHYEICESKGRVFCPLSLPRLLCSRGNPFPHICTHLPRKYVGTPVLGCPKCMDRGHLRRGDPTKSFWDSGGYHPPVFFRWHRRHFNFALFTCPQIPLFFVKPSRKNKRIWGNLCILQEIVTYF